MPKMRLAGKSSPTTYTTTVYLIIFSMCFCTHSWKYRFAMMTFGKIWFLYNSSQMGLDCSITKSFKMLSLVYLWRTILSEHSSLSLAHMFLSIMDFAFLWVIRMSSCVRSPSTYKMLTEVKLQIYSHLLHVAGSRAIWLPSYGDVTLQSHIRRRHTRPQYNNLLIFLGMFPFKYKN